MSNKQVDALMPVISDNSIRAIEGKQPRLRDLLVKTTSTLYWGRKQHISVNEHPNRNRSVVESVNRVIYWLDFRRHLVDTQIPPTCSEEFTRLSSMECVLLVCSFPFIFAPAPRVYKRIKYNVQSMQPKSKNNRPAAYSPKLELAFCR